MPKHFLHKSTYLAIGFVLIILLPHHANSQQADTTKKGIEFIRHYLLYRNHDSAYIKNYSENISVKLVAINKCR